MSNDEHLHRAFSFFDKDGNGYIEPDELRDALMEDGSDDCTNVANDIFQEVDTDKVNRPAHKSCMTKHEYRVVMISFHLHFFAGWAHKL